MATSKTATERRAPTPAQVKVKVKERNPKRKNVSPPSPPPKRQKMTFAKLLETKKQLESEWFEFHTVELPQHRSQQAKKDQAKMDAFLKAMNESNAKVEAAFIQKKTQSLDKKSNDYNGFVSKLLISKIE